MSLSHVKHVEAAAIMRRALEEAEQPPGLLTSTTKVALTVWLDENHPPPEAYIAALDAIAGEPS